MIPIPENYLDLLKDETKAFLFLATTMTDGSPQVTPIWFNSDGHFIFINSAKGRVKDRNMRQRPQVAVLIMNLAQPQRYLQIRGRVVKIEEEGALEHINTLSLKYENKPWKPVEGQVRVRYTIEPQHIDEH